MKNVNVNKLIENRCSENLAIVLFWEYLTIQEK